MKRDLKNNIDIVKEVLDDAVTKAKENKRTVCVIASCLVGLLAVLGVTRIIRKPRIKYGVMVVEVPYFERKECKCSEDCNCNEEE